VKEHQKGTWKERKKEDPNILRKNLVLKKTGHQISRILIIFGCIGYKFNENVTIAN